jgi:hypothetical protein
VQSDDPDFARELTAGLSVDLGRVGAARTAAAAVLAEAWARTPEALALYERGATRWREFGGVPQPADALLGQGRCLLSLGRQGAEHPLIEARALLQFDGFQVRAHGDRAPP